MNGFYPLASGSKGNSIAIKSEETLLLVDAGISAKQLRMRMQAVDLDLDQVEGVIVTHEHTDHIASLRYLNQKMRIPIFCNGETAKGIYQALHFIPKCKIFSTGERFSYKDIEVDPFTIPHDTLDPIALRLKVGELQLGICTDLGFVPSLAKKKLQYCDLLYVEANHDPLLVQQSSRPSVYKTRVLGSQGHLSNEAAAEFLAELYHKDLKAVYLAHLSSECNTKEKALEKVEEKLRCLRADIPIFIANQDAVSTPFFFAKATDLKTIHAI